MSTTKIWYGKHFANNGTVYKRFATVSQKNAHTLLKTIRERLGYESVLCDSMSETYLKKAIRREGNYLLLNSTQSNYIGVGRVGYNTALFIKD